ncbi:hypothetical protein CUMW_106500 [Citrus unshiu]|nr:hypothetical protein CUMW_106500 [Citrus unshiu]
MEEKVTPNNVDIARVAPTYHLYTPSEVEAVINRPMSIRRKSSLKILPWLQRETREKDKRNNEKRDRERMSG